MNNTIAYLNGQFLPLEAAKISPLDRGFSFGDGVYEVMPVYQGKIFRLEEHIDRLNASLKAIRMEPPFPHQKWREILETLVEKNQIPKETHDQWLYLQVTRGVDPVRDQQFPKSVPPTIFAVSYPKNYATKAELIQKGLRVAPVEDIRWKNCFIKTTARLAYVLMFQEVKDKGFDEAIIVREGFALEGSSSNFFTVKNNVILTPPKGMYLLSGITRDVILMLAKKNKISFQEVNITENDIISADEMWITSSARGIFPVVEYNHISIGNGTAGPLWSRLWDLYAEEINQFSMSFSH